MQIQTLGPAIGALVSDINLGLALKPEDQAQLHQALIEHHVLFFEGQDITAHQQRDLAAAFGELHIHPVYPQHPERLSCSIPRWTTRPIMIIGIPT